MRNIYPENGNQLIIDPTGNSFITQEEFTRLIVKFEELIKQFGLLEDELNNYKEANKSSITSKQLIAANAIIDEIKAVKIALDDLETQNLTADYITATVDLTAKSINAISADFNNIVAANIDARADLSAANATFETLKAVEAEIEKWTVETLSAKEINSDVLNSEQSTISKVNSDTISASDISAIRITAEESVKTPLVAADLLDAFDVTTSDLHWKEYQTFTDFDTFDLEIPAFQNGHYYIKFTTENGRALFAFETGNSLENYRCYWSQYQIGFLETISITKGEEKVVLHFNNKTDRFPLRIWFANISSNEQEAPLTYEVYPNEIQSVYEVTYKDGGKYWKPVDMWSTGNNLAYLETDTTSLFEETIDKILYDPSGEDKRYVIYKPDQEVNSDSSVRFQEVRAPFLEVEELDVLRRFRMKNIYNGEPVDPNSLPDDTIYIPSSTGERGSQALIVYDDKEYSSLENAMKGFTATDEWTSRIFSPAPQVPISYRDIDKFFIIDNRYAAIFKDDLLYMLDFDTAGTVMFTKAVIDGQPVYDEQNIRQIDELPDEFYVDFKKYTVTDKDVELFKETADWRIESLKGIIYRKSSNGVDEIIPIDKEVQDTVEPTNPLTYDADKRALVASDDIDVKNDLTVGGTLEITGKTKIEGDLEVGGNIDTAGDITADGDLTIAGDSVVSGKSTFADDVEVRGKLDVSKDINASSDVHIAGDLYVEGTQHITKTEDLDTEADIITLRTNNQSPLSDSQVSGILINKYDGEKDLALVTGNKGTLRVGTAKGKDTEYENIAYDPATQKWYEWEDGEIGDEVTLSSDASITSWENKRTEGSYTVYDKLTLTVINKTSLVPLLGRKEEEDLKKGHPLRWNADKLVAETFDMDIEHDAIVKWNDEEKQFEQLPLPDAPGQQLQADVDEDGKINYNWNVPNVTTFVGTVAEYEAAKLIPKGQDGYIPDKAMIVLTDDEAYINAVWPMGNPDYIEPEEPEEETGD